MPAHTDDGAFGRDVSRARLNDRRLVHAVMISYLGWGGVLKTFRRHGIDMAIVEMEHNHFTWADVDDLVRSANAYDVLSVVRVADYTYANVTRALDLGADGILVPRLSSRAEFEEVIDAMRLPPRGRKGVGGHDFAVDDLDVKLRDYNTDKLLLVQVENVAFVKDLPAILATGEIAGVIIGPFDLSVDLGAPGDFAHPQFKAVVSDVLQMCQGAEVSCGMFLSDDDAVREWVSEGMNLAWVGSDLAFIDQSMAMSADLIRELRSR